MQQEVRVAAEQAVQLGPMRALIRNGLIRHRALREKLRQALLRGGPRAPVTAVPHDWRPHLRTYLPQLMLPPCRPSTDIRQG